MHRRNVLVALFALLATLPLTACSAKLPDPATAVKAATQNAADAKTVRFEVTTTLEGAAGVEDYETEMSGAVDIDRERSVIVISAGFADVEVRVVEGTTYTRLFGDQWMASDEGEVPLADVFGEGSPLELLTDLGGKGSDIRRLGREEVRGQETTHYSVVVHADDLNSSVVDPFILESEEVEAGVWIGDDEMPARLQLRAKYDPDVLELETTEDVIFVFTVDLFDWGEPVQIEAPPADQIMDIDDDPFGGGSFGDPFEGAKCYGDRVAECLGVNADLDAKAADPALCQGPEARVCLVPVGTVRTDIVDAIVKFHKETANIDVLVLGSIPMADHWVTPESQVTEYEIYNIIKHVYGVTDDTPSTFIGITPIDIVPEDSQYGWMFGARFGSGPNGHNHGVFSTFRMENVEPYDGSGITDELVQTRASKYVGRYVALLHLDWPASDDIDYLNYSDMFGFSDLDSIGTKWPSGEKPCVSDTPMICIVPDGEYLDVGFEEDLAVVLKRLSADLGVRVEMRQYAGYYFPSQDSWSDEYANDLRGTMGNIVGQPNMTVIGVTDDDFAQAASVPAHVDKVWRAEFLAVVSGWDAGVPGTDRHQERIYQLLLRAIAQVHYGEPLNSDPTSLLFDGVTKPADLDGLTAPALP